jgi:hypothetical protein
MCKAMIKYTKLENVLKGIVEECRLWLHPVTRGQMDKSQFDGVLGETGARPTWSDNSGQLPEAFLPSFSICHHSRISLPFGPCPQHP